MKKLISLLLAFAMVFSLGLPAYAVDVNGETQGDVIASYTPTQAKWGASKDSLTNSGTLAEAIAAATASGSTVKYIQLQSDVTAESSFVIDSGEFTIDLNGNTVTCTSSHTFNVATKVTFADTGTNGAVTSEAEGYAAIWLGSGADVLITGGSYSGSNALYIESGSAEITGGSYSGDYALFIESGSAEITDGTFTSTGYYTINNRGILTISGGTIGSGRTCNVFVGGTTIITGGAFTGSDTAANFLYFSGTLDLSGYRNVTGLKAFQWTEDDLTVSDENIKLPTGYTFVDDSSNPVTTLAFGTVYTIAAAPTYTVTVSGSDNGTVTASPTSAAEGETVTLTVTPDEGYALDTLTVTDADGGSVTVENNRFTMPAKAVTVTATFKEAVKTYTVTIDQTITGGTVTVEPSTYTAGQTVTLTVTPAEGYELETLTVKQGETPVTVTDNTFVMPAGDVTVSATFKSTTPTQAKWGASKDSLTNSGTLAEAIAAAEADSSVKYIQLQSDVTAESSFVIRSGEFTIDLNGYTVTYTDNHAFNVATKVTFADTGTNGAVTGESWGYAAIALQYGADVRITGGSYSGYLALYLNLNTSATITGGAFTSTDGYAIDNAGTLTISGGTIGSGAMANVYVRGTTTITGGTFTGGGSDGNLSYSSGKLDLSSYRAVTNLAVSQQTGSDLAVSDTTIKLPTGYTFVDGSNNAVTTLASGYVYNIAAVTTYTVTVTTPENGTVTASPTSAAEGDTVTLTVTPDADYQIGTVTVTDAEGKTVAFTETGVVSGTYTFTMPASNVTVEATFTKIEKNSADIVWGSMAFTYTDGENGAEGTWSNDGSTGAGTVTVTNKGETAITAKVAYTAVEAYAEIEGSFDVSSAELAAEGSKTFTLTLKNQPAKAITAGTKIGSVTVTIE